MLRIHTETALDGVTLRLEGKLVHPWIDELFRAWTDLDQARHGRRPVRIDLDAVSFVDARGRSMLATLQHLGCELKGSGPFISAVIEEISAGSIF